jgi:RimJ/RimL family protein N-acetyltransferase
MKALPVFQTKRLTLRGVTEADAPSWQKNFADYEVIRNLAHHVPWPYPENGVAEFLKTRVLPFQGKDKWVWGIFLKDNPELIGVVDLWREGHPENRGFWLARKHWGKGIMTEAVEPVMDYAFNELGFEKLVFANAVGNIGSHRVKEKTGAKLLRVEPAKFVDPKFTEHEIWELKKEDWLKNRIVG